MVAKGPSDNTTRLNRMAVFGVDTDGNNYVLPLTNSGTALIVSGSITTAESINTSFESGQISCVANTSTEMSITLAATRSISFQAHINNSHTIFLGAQNSTSTGWSLLAGDTFSIDFNDTSSAIFAFCSATSLINYWALS